MSQPTRRAAISGLISAGLVRPALSQSSVQNYPDHLVRVICASAVGGGLDTSLRGLTGQLQERWRQTVLVDNRSGGSNNVAADAVARAAPDGYTLLSTTGSTMLVNKVLFKNLSYDPDALEPVAIVGFAKTVLAVRKDLPASNILELIDYAKQHPGSLTFGSSGVGSSIHLAMELLQMRTGIKLVHVPYRGTALAMGDLAAGHLDMIFVDLGGAQSLLDAGLVKIIGTPEPNRLAELPNVPTLAESGLSDIRTSIFWALMAPPKTPEPIRVKLNTVIRECLATPDLKKQFTILKAEPSDFDVPQMAAFIKSESALWTAVIRSAHIPAE